MSAPAPEPPFAESPTLHGILTRLKAGGSGAEDPDLRHRLDQAFSKHHARLHAHVASELRGFPPQQVEETVQEVLVVAWRKLPEMDGRHFRAWLLAIASNLCANLRRKKREVLSPDDSLFDVGSEAESAFARLRREERLRLFTEAAGRVLDPIDQEVVYMRYELELPRDEIALVLGLAGPEAVRAILQRTQRRLRRELEAVLAELGAGSSLFRPDGGEG